MADYPDETKAQRLGYCPDPSEDDGSLALRRVFSSAKYMQLVDEIIALEQSVFYPVYNGTGGTIPAGPVTITGYNAGTGYLVNGAQAQGLKGDSLNPLPLYTGTAPIAIGNIFTIAGVTKNLTGGLQIFTAVTALTGAGSIQFTPPLPTAAANNAAVTVNQGFKVSPCAGVEADLLVLSSMADKTWAIGVKVGSFLTASLDTTASTIGNPIYLTSAGLLSLTAPSAALYPVQPVAYVQTLANPGRAYGVIKSPTTFGTAQIGTGAVLDANVGAAAAIAGTKINPNFGSQVIITSGSMYIGSGSLSGSSALQIESTSTGVVFPRMTATQRAAISGPLDGMVVFDTTNVALYIYHNTAWNKIQEKTPFSGNGALNGSGVLNVSTSTNTSFLVANFASGITPAASSKLIITNSGTGNFVITSSSGATDSGANVNWLAY